MPCAPPTRWAPPDPATHVVVRGRYRCRPPARPLPTRTFDAVVIMIENVQESPDGITITAPVAPWQHVRMLGEDMVATEIVVPAGQRLRPMDLGAIVGCGHTQVMVRRRPRVVIVPTGSELVSAEGLPQPGQVIEYNSVMLGAQVEEAGGEAVVAAITADDPDALRTALNAALERSPDLVLDAIRDRRRARDSATAWSGRWDGFIVYGVAVRRGIRSSWASRSPGADHRRARPSRERKLTGESSRSRFWPAGWGPTGHRPPVARTRAILDASPVLTGRRR